MNGVLCYSFIVEWYKDESGLIKKYKLIYYPEDDSVEMHDIDAHRLFLRRMKTTSIRKSDLYIGSTINILARHLFIVDFGDEFTANKLAGKSERCMCIISPKGTCRAGTYIKQLESNGFKVVNIKLLYLNTKEIKTIFANDVECSILDSLASILADHGMLALELMRRDANSVLRNFIYGKGDPNDFLSNPDLFMLAQNAEAAAKQAHLLFSIHANQASLNISNIADCTCCVVKPHALVDGNLGAIWETIQSKGFCVINAQVFRLSKVDASEFLEVYKGVIAEYPDLVEEFTSGPCVALQVTCKYSQESFDASRDSNSPGSVQHAIRELVGPMDPEIAKYLKPDCIRAKYGINLIKNAIHCTDLPDDVPIDVDFFFRILNK